MSLCVLCFPGLKVLASNGLTQPSRVDVLQTYSDCWDSSVVGFRFRAALELLWPSALLRWLFVCTSSFCILFSSFSTWQQTVLDRQSRSHKSGTLCAQFRVTCLVDYLLQLGTYWNTNTGIRIRTGLSLGVLKSLRTLARWLPTVLSYIGGRSTGEFR